MYEKKIPKTFTCGLTVIMEIMGGKWKSYLIYLIHTGLRRPSELQKRIKSANRRVLDLQLRELEFHHIVKRVIYPETPLKVEYFLTDFGETLLPVIGAMDSWGTDFLEEFKSLMQAKQA
ncbi:DNA-binding HxlR family transcriptional regulator [Pedobacter sp. AK017]|uniref:winged helix-turn-helix transcriptional regulator n=1 Tax=Pedobacter sp. AK017 TaxID=2723073 RepID=UPI00160C1A94|nr:helix-turn-helix domain-containing protein [Pedobacter sp. AK017]MBB5441391.1 DNA-binding HxlR family transcriptional regulator [Pedobacter sp. AK017]